MARRLTKKSPFHISQWRKPVEVDAAECDSIRKALEKSLGASEALEKLPKACKEQEYYKLALIHDGETKGVLPANNGPHVGLGRSDKVIIIDKPQ